MVIMSMYLNSGMEACPSETFHLWIYVFQSLRKLYSKCEVVRREKVGVGVCLPRGMPCLMPEGCHSVLPDSPCGWLWAWSGRVWLGGLEGRGWLRRVSRMCVYLVPQRKRWEMCSLVCYESCPPPPLIQGMKVVILGAPWFFDRTSMTKPRDPQLKYCVPQLCRQQTRLWFVAHGWPGEIPSIPGYATVHTCGKWWRYMESDAS